MRIRAIRHQFAIRASVDYKMHPKRIHIYLTEIAEILRITTSQWEALRGLEAYAERALGFGAVALTHGDSGTHTEAVHLVAPSLIKITFIIDRERERVAGNRPVTLTHTHTHTHTLQNTRHVIVIISICLPRKVSRAPACSLP